MGIADIKERIASSGILTNPLYIKYRQFIVPGIVLVIAILISALVTIPQFFRLFETYKTIGQLSEQKVFFQTKVAKLKSIDQNQEQKDLDTALLALPVDKNIPGVTGELLVALSGSGMSLDGIAFSNSPAESEKVEEFTLRMDVTGSQGALTNFLSRVKLTPRIVKLTSLDVSKGKDNKIAATVGLVTLYQQLPKNINAVDEAVPEIVDKDTQVLADIRAKAEALPSANSGQTASSSAKGKLNPFAQ